MSSGTIGRLYTQDFKELKKSEKISLCVSLIALVISIIALFK
jgi:hypothetical protein